MLIGSFGTAVGSWIKVFSASPNLFPVAFIGHTVVAISQIFILGIPPLLSAIWFGPDQASSATAIGVFGNQVRLSRDSLNYKFNYLLPTNLGVEARERFIHNVQIGNETLREKS